MKVSTKEWLLRAWQIDNEITALENELVATKDRMFSVTGHYDNVKVQTSSRNGTENAIYKYIEYQEKINKRLDMLYSVKSEIADAISYVDNPTYRTLLELRYLRFMKWERIAEELEMSDRWVRSKLHYYALESVKKFIFT